MTGSRPGLGHRTGLDGLRALAVLAVLAFHAGVLRAGWIGVDVFFALSGYLITGLLLAEADAHGSIRLGDFWRRRARRLIPAVILMLAVVAIFDRLGAAAWRGPSRSEVWGAVTYTSNWVRLAGDGSYWQLFVAPSPLEHVWSLAIEEQFYVLWPLVVIVAWHARRRRGVVEVTAFLIAVAAGWQLWLGHTADLERVYVGTDTRAPAFLLGALLVAAIDHHGRTLRAARRIVPAGLLALFVACLTLDGRAQTTYTGGLLVVSIVGSTTVWAAARLDPATLIGRMLAVTPLQRIGRWSYGIYLFHWPIAVLIGVQRFEPWLQFAVLTVLSTALAALTYELIENPIRRGGLARWQLAPFAAATGVVLVAVLATTTPERPSITAAQRIALLTPITPTPVTPTPVSPTPVSPTRVSPTRVSPTRVSPTRVSPTPAVPSAASSNTPIAAAPASPEAAPPTAAGDTIDGLTTSPTATDPPVAIALERVLVVGDSVPFHLTESWQNGADARRLTVVVRAAPGCRPSAATADQLRLDTAELCADMLANIDADLDAFRPQVLVVHFGLADEWIRQNGRRVDACSESGRSVLAAQIGTLIDDAAAVGATTYVVIPNDPPDGLGLDRSGANIVGARCYRQTYLDLAASRGDAVALRLDTLVCPDGEAGCAAVVDGQALRDDGIHFTDFGAAIVVTWMLDRIGDAVAGGAISSG